VSETIGVMGIHQDVIGRVEGHCLFRSPLVIILLAEKFSCEFPITHSESRIKPYR
jgi:hypothetical protein